MELFQVVHTTCMFLAFFISSWIFVYCDFWIKCSAVLFAAAVFLILRIGGARIFPEKTDSFRRGLSFVLCACAAAGIYSIAFFDVYYGIFSDYAGQSDAVRVRIESCDYSLSYMARYHAVVTDSDLIPDNTQILLSTEQVGLEDGTILEGTIVYSALSESSSGGFNAERYYLPKRILLTAEDESLRETGKENPFRISSLFRRLNHKLTVRLIAHAKREYGGTAAAVLLGNKEYLPDQTSRDFRRLGVSHLLVVSGTHFSVLLTFASRAMIRMRINRRKRAGVSILLILFYMALTGFSASVLRAGIMYLIAQMALLADRRVNELHSLAFAGSAIVLFNPFAAADCGLLLSFTATYSCLMYNSLRTLFYRHRREKRKAAGKPRRKYRKPNLFVRILRNTFGVIGLTAVVNITLLPLIWLYFGEFSLLSIPANIVFIPLVTILMYLTALFLIQYPLGILTYPLAQCINRYCTVMLGLAGTMSELEKFMVPVNYRFTVWFLVPLTVMLVMIPFVSEKRFRILVSGIFTVLAAFFLVIGIVRITDRPNVYFSYVTAKARNDGFVLKSEGKVLLCDISDGSYSYLSELICEMSDLHACEAETLLLTHYHNKHLSSLGRLCDREVLRTLVLPEPMDERENGIYQSLCNTAEREGVTVHTVSIGEPYEFGNAEILLHERMYISRSTHPITAVSVSAYDNLTTILSCSFNQSHVEITEYAERSDFLIFGHHSPVYKKTFGLSFENMPKAVITSDAACEYMTEEFSAVLGSLKTIHEPAGWCLKTDQSGNCTTIE